MHAANLHTMSEEWRAVRDAGATQLVPIDMAELCLNRQHSHSSFSVTMPTQISPSEMACPPRRFEKKARVRTIPSGPSCSAQCLIAPGCGKTLNASDQLASEENEAPATGPLD